MNYRERLVGVFPNIFTSADNFNDPNSVIDSIVTDINLEWYPPFLYKKGEDLYLIIPFSNESYLDESEIVEECEKAEIVCRHIEENHFKPKVLFIIQNIEDSNILHNLALSDYFGLIHLEAQDQPFLELDIDPNFLGTLRFIPFAARYLSDANNLSGAIGEKIREIATQINESTIDMQYEKVKQWIKELLACDDRFVLDDEPIEFMSNMERFLAHKHEYLQDHYFHAFNTMLLGFFIIDKDYERFAHLCNCYGNDILVEYIWLITSLYHDIGYPSMLFDDLARDVYEDIEDSESIDRLSKQLRQNLWESQYKKAANYLNNFFIHIKSETRVQWVIDPFPYPTSDDILLRSLQVSFIDQRHHGAHGALKLAQMISNILKNIEIQEDRQFIYRHILISSISILFHDAGVRRILKENTCSNIKALLFPFSALLTYIDILQDDRRDLTSSYSRPDILRNFTVRDGEILGVLDSTVIENQRKKSMLSELRDAISFFIMNGITFKIPEELLI